MSTSLRVKVQHEFKITPDHIKRGQFCPGCSRFVSEQKCREILESLTGEKFEKVKMKVSVVRETKKSVQTRI